MFLLRANFMSENSEKIFAVKMRANSGKKHISGAERIVFEGSIPQTVKELLDRASLHENGSPEEIHLKIETINPKEIQTFQALPVKEEKVKTASEGLQKIGEILEQLGVSSPEKILELFKETYSMRGAMLLHADTLVRFEPDKERGVRATYMDSSESLTKTLPRSKKNHFIEALVLATKVANAPGIIAEICISDDPGYVTGYIAGKNIGYVRISKLKEFGSPLGGRIFLFRGNKEEASSLIEFLERAPILVTQVEERFREIFPVLNTNVSESLSEKLSSLRKNHLLRSLLTIESPSMPKILVNQKSLLLFSSNNYLGFANEREIKEAAHKAIDNYGFGTGGSRLTTGTQTPHIELESKLAQFKGTEGALLFNSGYAANVGVLSSLADSESIIFSDALNHASIIDGARLSRAKIVVYKHNDMDDLEKMILTHPAEKRFLVSDAVFSMDGDILRYPKWISLAQKYGLFSIVDEAHSTGVISVHGITEYFKTDKKPDVMIGTLSKALGSEGGFAATSSLVKEYLLNSARSFIFSTALPAASSAAALAALRMLEQNDERVRRLKKNIRFFCSALGARELNVHSESAIIPIEVKSEARALKISSKLLSEGIFIPAIRYPTVPKGAARLRASLMALHTEEELAYAAEKIAKACEAFP